MFAFTINNYFYNNQNVLVVIYTTTFISGIIIITKHILLFILYIRLYKILRSMHDVVKVTRSSWSLSHTFGCVKLVTGLQCQVDIRQ